MKSRWWISVGLVLCVSIPFLARAEEWVPLGMGMRWSYRISGINRWAIAGMEQTQRVEGTRNVEVRDIATDLPQAPYEVVDARATRVDGRSEMNRELLRTWVSAGKRGVLGFGEEFADPFAGGLRQMVRYSPPLQLLPADPHPGQTWHVGVARAMGLRMDFTGKVIGIRDVEIPAGLQRGCLEVRFSGPISGQLDSPAGPLPIRSGSVTITSYYAPGLGSVLEQEHYEMRLSMPGGQIVKGSMRADYALRSSSLLPSAPASSDRSQRR
jgi:hypothetical protein